MSQGTEIRPRACGCGIFDLPHHPNCSGERAPWQKIARADEEIARYTFETPIRSIFQTVVIRETPDGQVYATVAAHAKDRPPPDNATCIVTDEAEVKRLAEEVLAAKRAEAALWRPSQTQMLKRSRAQASTTAEG